MNTLWAWAETKLMAALVCVAVLAIACLGCYQAGLRIGAAHQQTSDAQAALRELQRAHTDYQAAVASGDQTVQTLQSLITELRTQRDQIIKRTAHAPIVTRPPACPDAGSAHLTRAGVLQWNAALGYHELPAAAGGAADPAARAAAADAPDSIDAADSGISLGQARDNAQTNFATCAEIRARCQSLIDLAKQRQPSLEPHP